MGVLSRFSRVRLFTTLRTIAHQAPLSLGFSRQEYWSGLPCPPPENLPDPGIEATSLMSPELSGGFFATSAIWEALRGSLHAANEVVTVQPHSALTALMAESHYVLTRRPPP